MTILLIALCGATFMYVAIGIARFVSYTVTSYALVDAAHKFARNGAYAHTMLVLGDSTAVGVGSHRIENTVAGRTALLLEASVENRAQSGAKTTDTLRSIQAVTSRFDIILIQVGGNDIIRFTPLAEISVSLDALLSKARESSSHIILLSCADVGSAPLWPRFIRAAYSRRTRAVRSIFLNIAQKHGIEYIDLLALPDVFSSDPARYYAADGLHLSDDGYGVWFAAVRDRIVAQWPWLVVNR